MEQHFGPSPTFNRFFQREQDYDFSFVCSFVQFFSFFFVRKGNNSVTASESAWQISRFHLIPGAIKDEISYYLLTFTLASHTFAAWNGYAFVRVIIR